MGSDRTFAQFGLDWGGLERHDGAMPRQLRMEYEGAIYHVLSRGDRSKAIYLDDVDRQDFLKTLAETCQKTGFRGCAWGAGTPRTASSTSGGKLMRPPHTE